MEIKLCMLLATIVFMLCVMLMFYAVFTVNKIEKICFKRIEDKEFKNGILKVNPESYEFTEKRRKNDNN